MKEPHSFVLEPKPPFRLDLTVWTLRRRPENIIDRWDGETYRRVLVENSTPFEISVVQMGSTDSPRLRVTLSNGLKIPDLEKRVTLTVERLLGLQVDLTKFYHFGERDEFLKSLLKQFVGLKPPRFSTYFETLVNAIACQQLSLTVGIRLLNRLAETCGPAVKTEDGIFYGFPRPQDLLKTDLEMLRGIGFSYRKAGYLLRLAHAILEKEFDLQELHNLSDKEAVNRLSSLKGVGRWTAEYFLLRGLGRTHIFPGDDVGARNNLQRWLNLPENLNYNQVKDVVKRWDGYGGLIYFHLLLKSLTDKRVIST